MTNIDLSPRLVASIAQCFYGYGRPTGSAIDQAYRLLDVPLEVGHDAPNKEVRVSQLLLWLKDNAPERAGEAIEHLVRDLHDGGHLDPAHTDDYIGDRFHRQLTQSLAVAGFRIDSDGSLVTPQALSAESLPANREHVQQQIARLTRSTDDPAAIIGHTKDLLETVAKTVIAETGGTVNDSLDFGPLLRAAKDALPLMPPGLDSGSRETNAIERFINGLWIMANSVNELRNAVGTGHGRLNSPTFDAAIARTVSDGGITLARLWLMLLDGIVGDPA